jgi:hypothetical protein
MMASIPNMRSAPLPLPGTKAAPAGEAAPGDFAAQMPAVPGLPAEVAVLLPETIVDPAAPVVLAPEAPATGEGDGEAETPETKVETPKPDQATPVAVVIPFLPAQPGAPAPQTPAAVSAEVPIPAQSKRTPVVAAPAGKPAKIAAEPGADGTALPLPAIPDAAEGQPETATDRKEAAAVEAAVKALLQRKQGPAKQAAPDSRPADSAKPDVAAAQVQPQPQTQPTAPAAIHTPAAAALPAPDQPQPLLALPAPQPAPLKAEASDGAAGTRTSDLAVERQLDLARDAQWLDRLARDIARAGASDTPLRFRLHPQTLGHLHVELQQGDHGTAVRLTVETEAARQILADAQPRLAAEARAQGVRIAETHVDLSGSGREAPGDRRRQDESRQNPLIRTAPGAGMDAVASARSSARARLDRYA